MLEIAEWIGLFINSLHRCMSNWWYNFVHDAGPFIIANIFVPVVLILSFAFAVRVFMREDE